jgi:hypothetical protein
VRKQRDLHRKIVIPALHAVRDKLNIEINNHASRHKLRLDQDGTLALGQPSGSPLRHAGGKLGNAVRRLAFLQHSHHSSWQKKAHRASRSMRDIANYARHPSCAIEGMYYKVRVQLKSHCSTCLLTQVGAYSAEVVKRRERPAYSRIAPSGTG